MELAKSSIYEFSGKFYVDNPMLKIGYPIIFFHRLKTREGIHDLEKKTC
jgi:hypothetical protein